MTPTPDHPKLKEPDTQGLRWGLTCSVATAALLHATDRAADLGLRGRLAAWLLGSLGVGVLGYGLGADMARQHNRTCDLEAGYRHLLDAGSLRADTLPRHGDHLRERQHVAVEGMRRAALLGAGSATLAAGVEALMSPSPRPLRAVALEWGVIGAVQGFAAGILEAREHNRRAAIIGTYERMV